MIKDYSLILISGFTFFLIVMLINSIYQIASFRRKQILDRLRGVETKRPVDQEEVFDKPFLQRLIGPLANFLKNGSSKLAPKAMQQAVQNRLIRAGKTGIKATDFIAFLVIISTLIAVVSWFLLSLLGTEFLKAILHSMLIGFLGGFVSWFSLGRSATQRQEQIRKRLPDAMDLLVISVEAGLAFDMALQKVAQQFPGPLAEEFNKTLHEMKMGMSRKEALKGLGRRVDIEELKGMVSAVIQSDQLGSSLAGVLRMQGDLIRTKRQQQIEERAMKAPIKMLFPLVFFIFPSMFVVLLGPAFINIMRVLGDMGK
ncbi:type II secretion system F family protein [Metallumcola ferriviriculae]|uniref:Type II secretion system F family protein n=1 Tax=Metallumcola ferriviriculae TaxID=3039180 RepID=A0AAU0ULD1_9FIRM|nr:type II secretion system F family protein [Desulfitibacteraceae bacterium MK1]